MARKIVVLRGTVSYVDAKTQEKITLNPGDPVGDKISAEEKRSLRHAKIIGPAPVESKITNEADPEPDFIDDEEGLAAAIQRAKEAEKKATAADNKAKKAEKEITELNKKLSAETDRADEAEKKALEAEKLAAKAGERIKELEGRVAELETPKAE